MSRNVDATCEVCNNTQLAPEYGDWKCVNCGQEYEYNEGHTIVLRESQIRSLRENQEASVGQSLLNGLQKFTECNHQTWKCQGCGCSTSISTIQRAGMAHKLNDAFDEIRDAILHERFQLAEAGLDCDQINAILGIIDDHDPRNQPNV